MQLHQWTLVLGVACGAMVASAPALAQSTTDGTTANASNKGNTDISMALAKAAATTATNPNPSDSQVAQQLDAISKLRAQGQGWGQIANSLGLRLGDVVSASKTEKNDSKESQSRAREDRSANSEKSSSAGGKSGGSSGGGGGGRK